MANLQVVMSVNVKSTFKRESYSIEFNYTKSKTIFLNCIQYKMEDRRLRVSENSVLRKIFRPTMDEVTGEWRRLHNEELNDLYCLPNIVRETESRRMRWAGHVARMGYWRSA